MEGIVVDTKTEEMPYRLDVGFKSTRDGLCMFSTLLGDQREVADLISVILLQVFQGV